jgi:ABC-2 type transport system permease protein/sodium transport system permease protein
MFALAVMFPSYFLAAGSLAQLQSASLVGRLVTSALITVFVFAAIPTALAVFHRVQPMTGLGLRAPRLIAIGAAVVLGLALWPFAYEIYFLNELFGISNLNFGQLSRVRENVAELQGLPFALVVATLAVVPGVCEEFFFRGLLFTSLRRGLSARGAIVAAALVFGFFHAIVGTLFLPERFLPSVFLGIALGWVRWRTSSVIPAMFLHTAHNSVLLSLAYWQDELLAQGIGIDEQTHLPLTWLAAAALAAIVAAVLIHAKGLARTGHPTVAVPLE